VSRHRCTRSVVPGPQAPCGKRLGSPPTIRRPQDSAAGATKGILELSGRDGSNRVKTASTLVVPAGLLALTALAVNLPGPPPDQLASFLRVYPWVVWVVGLLLGLRLRRGRVVFALLALALADRVLASFPRQGTPSEAARFALAATAFLLPLDLTWMALTRELGTLTPRGLMRLTVILTQPAVAALLWLSFQPRLAALLEHRFLPQALAPSVAFPHVGLFVFTCALVATTVAWIRRRTFLESGFFWAVATSLLALTTEGQATTTYLATAGLILVASLVESTFAMAYRDGLTGLPGRRAFDEALTKLSGRYAIAMVDIDHFKEVNDRYGHDVGDQVLRMVASKIANLSGARAFRYGGEEFALILPAKSRSQAVHQLDVLRGEIGKSGFALRSGDRPKKKPKRVEPRGTGITRLQIKVSAGVAERGGRLLKPEEVLTAADEALYRAKRGGRNRVST
jgi:diguanylate cyclase (GGDEF)-like protein